MRSLAAPLIKLGVFAAITIVATTLLAVTISNVNFNGAPGYTARFTDVTALNEGDDNRIAGVRVGQVDEIRVVDRRLAEVEFSLEGDRTLPASVTATIKYRNLVGQRYVSLEHGVGDASALRPGDVIPLERTKPALDLTVLFNGFKPLFQALNPDDVNKLSNEIIQVLQGEGGTIDSLLRHTASLTSTLASRDQVIGEVITNLHARRVVVRGDGRDLIGERLGIHRSNMTTLMRRDGVEKRTHVAAAALFDELWRTPAPAESWHEKSAATRARNYAAARRWLPCKPS